MLTKLENIKKMGKYLKIKKKLWYIVVSKPEHHNLRPKTPKKTKFEFSRKKEHSLIADTKLQVEQLERKMEANSISHFLFINQLF